MPNRSEVGIQACLAVAERLRSIPLNRHEARVGGLCSMVARHLGLEVEYSDAIGHAGSLHDVGKLAVADTILCKPAPLDANEWLLMCEHPMHGYEILVEADTPITNLAATVALCHHEYFEGSGYPKGLYGDDIPCEARIVTVCDIYDALREHRAYKADLGHELAISMILDGDGTKRLRPAMFDRDVLGVFSKHAAEIGGFYAASIN